VNTYLSNPLINSLALSGNRILAGSDGGGIFATDDLGAAWQPMNEGLTGASVTVMTAKGTQIMAGTSGAGYFLSNDNGNNWFSRNNGIPNRYITAIAGMGDKLFAGTSGAGLYVSENQGINWIPSGNGISGQYISSLCLSGSDLYAGTDGSGVFISADSGSTWTAASLGITDSVITSVAVCDQKIYAGTQNSGVFYSTDRGNTWSGINTGLPNLMIKTLAGREQTLFTGTPSGLYRLSMSGASWVPLSDEGKAIRARTISFFGSAVFTGTDKNGVLLSLDNGDTWESLATGLPGCMINSLAATGMNLFAGTGGSGTWKRPMSGIFTNKVNPDTLILKQTQDFFDTLHIQSNVDWSILGNFPDWFSLDKKNGTGTDAIVVRTLQPNLGYLARYTTLYLFSSVAPTVTFTVLQLGKTAGLEDDQAPVNLRLSAMPGEGFIDVSAGSEIKDITIYSILGCVISDLTVNAKTTRLYLSSMGKGIYIIKISGHGWTVNKTFSR